MERSSYPSLLKGNDYAAALGLSTAGFYALVRKGLPTIESRNEIFVDPATAGAWLSGLAGRRKRCRAPKRIVLRAYLVANQEAFRLKKPRAVDNRRRFTADAAE